jgi:GDP-4-dehydro-6-deoxy-D-mannose reductase
VSGPVLVTGAAGFVGQHLLRLLVEEGPVVAWHRPGTDHPDVDGVTWAAVELLDRAEVAQAIAQAAPAEIYHLAGVPHVGDSWAHAEETLAGNVVGTMHLFDALRAARL